MAQEYDTTGKDILNERINEIARFVLNVPDVEVLADLDTEQQLVRAFRTDITKRIRINTRDAVLHIELQLQDSTEKPMWAGTHTITDISSVSTKYLSIPM